jgi:uncharacterized membrane protein
MRPFFLLVTLLFSIGLFAQTPVVVPPAADATLPNRYIQMKTSSEAYQDYKVIKEVKLDEFWKVVMDSVKRMKLDNRLANQSIAKLNDDLKNANEKVSSVQASVAGLVYDSQHISFFGIHFSKWVFNGIFMIVTGVLVFFIIALLGRARLVNQSIKEKSESLTLLTDEFDQYKRKALEKEKKLSRELQTERNKLLELKRV